MPTTLVVPKHIGFVLDGNRRFARLRGMKPWRGHDLGRDKTEELLDWCYEFGVSELTLYTFSLQNFKRPAREVAKLMDIIESTLLRLADDPKVIERKVSLKVIGQTELLPERVQKAIRTAEAKTAKYDGLRLNLCIAYGGKEEILEAAKLIAKKIANKIICAADLTIETFESHLFLKSEPDLIIRTGGECRTSNFLSWQSGYSEWFFVDKLLPEFEREDLVNIFREYGQRERRFGK